jgi:hypothetical protein
MRALVYGLGFVFVAALCTQVAFAGPVPPPSTPDLDVSTLGYIAFAVTGTYVAFKNGLFGRVLK